MFFFQLPSLWVPNLTSSETPHFQPAMDLSETAKLLQGPGDAANQDMGIAFDASSRVRRAGVEFYHRRCRGEI